MKTYSHTQSPLMDKSKELALLIIETSRILKSQKNEYDLSRQIVRSGTSIGANITEAQNSASSKDFINKLNIAQKECAETLYWLELLFKSNFITRNEFESQNNLALEILRMLKSSIKTSKSKLND